MKVILIGILAFNTNVVSAQNMTKAQFATLLKSKKATLESVKVGMSKSTVTSSSVTLEDGTKCEYTQEALQSILKIEGDKMIVLSRESFKPVMLPDCALAGLQPFEENVIFYEAKPTLAQDLEDLEASDVKSIGRAGEIVTMVVEGKLEDGTAEAMTVKYDLSKSSFKNLILSQSPSSKTETSDVADIDVNSVDLRDVVFCENNDSDNSDCVRGDFSDILF